MSGVQARRSGNGLCRIRRWRARNTGAPEDWADEHSLYVATQHAYGDVRQARYDQRHPNDYADGVRSRFSIEDDVGAADVRVGNGGRKNDE